MRAPERTAPEAAGSTEGPARDPHAVLCCRFPAGNGETRAILEALCTALGRAGLDEDDIANAELVVAEVLNNIVEHAYARGGGTIELRAEARPDGVACLVRDLGSPMPGGSLPGGDLPEARPPDSLPEGGFGWHIIRCLTRELRYRRAGGCNELSFVVPYAGFD